MDIIRAHLKAAFEKPGCPVCRLCQEAEIAYIRTLLYDYVNDGLTRLGFIHSQGWCPRHAWLLQASEQLDWGDGLKTAIIYESVASLVQKNLSAYLTRYPAAATPESYASHEQECGEWRRGLRRLGDVVAGWFGKRPPDLASTNRLLARLSARAECPVCEVIAGKESLIVAKLADGVLDARFRAALRASDGLCLPHLREALACSPSEEATHLLVEAADEKLTLLLAHLRGYIDKHRWQDRTLLCAEEKVA
ncbi:MAG: hypothetical protein H5T69_15235, partial [Chloroflexi bacterium]|nr:hypothetical protein [Chloroflexota bacterium]